MLKLSASAIACFKACPCRYYLNYIKRIKSAKEKTSLRWGSNWHTVLEILSMEPSTKEKPNHYKFGSTKYEIADDPMETAVEVLNDLYADKAGSRTPEELQVEKIQILYMASAYRWYYANEPLTILTREQRFDIPVLNPATGRKKPGIKISGMIDKTGMFNNKLMIIEHKSTSKPINSDATYWARLNLDTQTTLYPYATRYIKEMEQINGVLYDVVHKPTIAPKKLSFADTDKFIKSGEYCGQKFDVQRMGDITDIHVNNITAICEPGKKDGDIAIHETPEMYGARLLQDISERPTFYFARKEITRTDADIERFSRELLCMVDTIKHMTKNDSWFHNESSCEATFQCDYIDLCYNNINPDGELPATLIRKDK